jgi:hypothetical protein
MSSDQARLDELYRRLELGPDASREEIARAYRRLAHGAHPDAHPGDPDAARRFRQLAEAYEVLADPARRASYDAARQRAQARVAPAAQPRHQPAGPPLWAAPSTQWLTDLGPVEAGGPPLRAGPVHVEPDHTVSPASGGHRPAPIDPLIELLWCLERWLR